MSLSTCLKGVDPKIADRLLDQWNTMVAGGMSEYNADRKVLRDYASELNDRLNTVKQAAGKPSGKLVNLARTAADINSEIDTKLKALAPVERLVEQAPVEMIRPVTDTDSYGMLPNQSMITMDQLEKTREFYGTLVEFVDHIAPIGQRTDPVAFRNVNKGEKFQLVKSLFIQKFEQKAWTRPVTLADGSMATPLAADAFATVDEFLNFALFHEQAHNYLFQEEGEKIGSYEDRINQEALRRFTDVKPVTTIPEGMGQVAGTAVNKDSKGNKYYKGNVEYLAEHQVFVFGANDQGKHGKGAAGVAMGEQRELKQIEALPEGTKGKWTVKGKDFHSKIVVGTEGKSYPMVTVTGKIGSKTVANRLDRQTMLKNIEQLYKTAAENPQYEFLIGYQANTDEAGLSGYKPIEMADLFASFPVPENIVFEMSMMAQMDNVPRRFLAAEVSTADQSLREPSALDATSIRKARDEQFIEIKDANGKGTGVHFTADQQIQATNSIIYETSQLIAQKKHLSGKELKDAIRMKFQNLQNKLYIPRSEGRPMPDPNEPTEQLYPGLSSEQAVAYRDNMTGVLNSFDDLFEDAALRLELYGIRMKKRNQGESQAGADEISIEEGKGVEQFHDLIFTLDPRDTASGRLKLFMATIEEVMEGVKPRPKTVKVPLTKEHQLAIMDGTKHSTVRRQDQLKEMRLSVQRENDTGVFRLGDKWYKIVAEKTMTREEAAEYNASEEAEDMAFGGDVKLSITEYVPEQGLVSIKSFIGVPMIADFESLFEDTTGQLADRAPSFEGYLQILRGSSKLVLQRLAEKLDSPKTPVQVKKEFVTVMTKAFTEYGVVLYSKGKRGITVNTINANAYSIRKTLISRWQEQQKLSPIMARDKAGNFMMAPQEVESLKEGYEALKLLEADQKQKAAVPGGQAVANKAMAVYNQAAMELVKQMFTLNGIVLRDEAYKDLFENLQKYTGEANTLMGQWSVNSLNVPQGLFSRFMNKLLQESEGEEIDNPIAKNNPLYTEPKTMTILAKVYMRHAETLYNSSHRNLKGESIWDYTLNTYLTHAFNELTEFDPAYRQQLGRTDFAKNNWLLKIINENPKARAKMSLEYLEGLKKKRSKSAAERQEMSDRDQLFLALSLYTNNGNNDVGHFLSLTHSDKTRTPLFRNVPRTLVMTGNDISPQLIDRLSTVFYSEFDRISSGNTKTYDVSQQYENGKKYFYLMPMFNYDSMVDLVKKGVITEAELAYIWTSKDVLNTAGRGLDEFGPVLDKLLYHFVLHETAKQVQEFEKAGIVNYAEGTHLIEQKYVDRYVQKHRKIQSTKDGFIDTAKGMKTLTKDQFVRQLAIFTAMDYAMNTFLVNTAMVQLVYGDPAQVFKNSVSETILEYQKRMAGPIAPGKETEWENPFYRTVTLADFKIGLDYIEGIPAYAKGVNVTDAQEFVTMEEHLRVMRQYGQIDEDVYQEMVSKIKPGEDYQFDEKHMHVVLQIMKPVYYGKRIEQDGVLLHDYIKSSAMPLYPPYTRGKEIDRLRREMERPSDGTPPIDRAHFISARKVGAPAQSYSFDKKGVFQGIEKAAISTLDRSGFRIQQEVPHDPDKQEVLTASQTNKVIISDMPEGIRITLRDGRSFDRKGIREFKEGLRMTMINEALQEFTTEMNVGLDANNVYTFKDPAKFIERLIKEGEAKNYSKNELQPFTHLVDGKPISPLYFTSLADPMESLMMSMVDKIVKVKVPGKSYVQASSVGITKMATTAEGIDGITWMPGYSGSIQLRMPERIDGKVEPAGILVPFNFFSANGKLKLKDFLNEDGTVNVDKLPSDVLEMVGIRIPTGGHNSMLPMKIIGFLPENMGDTIIVPPGITVQMGSDFDVDKLFVYQRPYAVQEGGRLAQTDGTFADYFDIHWQILTHPMMYDKMMSPLDKDDLKKEAELASKKKTTYNPWTGRTQRADFISQKDAKNLVGFSALTNTFLAGIQEMDMYVGKLSEPDENGDPTGFEPDPLTAFGGLKLFRLSGYGKSVAYNGETRSKLENVVLLMNEFLDHAKNRTIDKLNLTTHTYGAAAALVSLEDENGQAVNLQYVARLLRQEYMVKFNEKMSRGEDMFSGYHPNLKESIFTELEQELIKDKGASSERAELMQFDQDALLTLLNPERNTDYYTAQLALLRAFKKLDGIGQRMSEMASLLNQDVKGTGGSLFNVLDKIAKKDSILDSNVIINGQEMYAGEKGYIAETVNSIAGDLFDQFLPHKQIFDTALGAIREITGKSSMTSISLDVKKSVLRSLRSFVYSGKMELLGVNDVSSERARLLYNTSSGPSLAQRVVEAQSTWGRDNYFLKRLATVIGDGIDPHAVNFIAAKATRMDDNENVRAWLDMLLSSDRDQKILAEDLIRYAFLTGGIQDANSFVKYVPFGYMSATGWFDALQHAYLNLDVFLKDANFVEQWFRHNPERAIQIAEGFAETGSPIKGIPEEFGFPYPDAEKPSAADEKFMVRSAENGGKLTYTSYLSYRSIDGQMILYRKTSHLNGEPNGGVRYVRIDTMGSSLTDEYNSTNSAARSIVPTNRASNTMWMAGRRSADATVKDPVQETVPEPMPSAKKFDPKYDKRIPVEYVTALKLTELVTSEQELKDKVIPALLASGELPGVYHTLLEQIGKMTLSAKHHELIKILQSVEGAEDLTPELKIRISDDMRSNAGYVIPFNEIQLPIGQAGIDRIKTISSRGLQEVLIHEMVHWITGPYLETAARKATGQYDRRVMGRGLDQIEMDPKLVKSAEALYALYEQATELILKNELTDATAYAFSNIHEFVVHATVNAEFMKVLNSLPATNGKNRTMLDQVWDLLNTLFNNIAEFMGEPVKKDSILSEALPHLVILSTHNQGIKVLNADVVKHNGKDVMVGVDDNGKAIKVRDDFMTGQPEPRRQEEISRILSQYNFNPNVDSITGRSFRTGQPTWATPEQLEGWEDKQLRQDQFDKWADAQPLEEEDEVPDTGIPDDLPFDVDPPIPPEAPSGPKPTQESLDKDYELFPGVFANQMQRTAIDQIPDHIRTATGSFADRSFVLSGAGGTGKTTIIRKIAEQFPDKKIVFAAPSHNAVVELKKALGTRNIKKNGWKVNTLQSELDMKRDHMASAKAGKDVFVQKPGYFKKAIESADVVIIDETSMVGNQLIQFMKEKVPPRATIIFMGDYAQLQPIEDGKMAWAFREVMPYRGVRLIENMRTSKADIAAVLNQYREAIDNIISGQQQAALPVIPYKTRASTENVTLINSQGREGLVNAFVKQFELDPKNPTNALIICYRNDTRKALNKAIREKRFGVAEAAAAEFLPGDLVIFNQGTPPLDSEEGKILDKYFGTKKAFPMQRVVVETFEKIPLMEKTIRTEDDVKYTVSLPGHRMKANLGPDGENYVMTFEAFDKNAVASLLSTVRKAKYVKSPSGYDLTGYPDLIKLFGSNFVSYGKFVEFEAALKEMSMDIEHAYTVTSHKSQGSTYNHTFVDEKDINDVSYVPGADPKDMIHSLYTAVSRTREHLYIYHPYQPGTKVANAAESLNALSDTIANGSNGPWKFRNESEVFNAMNKANDLFPHVPLHRDGDIVSADFMPQDADSVRQANNIDPTVSKVIKKLEAQIDVISDSMSGSISSQLRAEKQLQIKKIEDDILSLKMHNNLEAISQVGKRQMEWIKKTAERKDPSPTEIMTAWGVTDVWTNIFDILYGDSNTQGLEQTHDPVLAQVAAEAAQLRHSLLNSKMIPAMTELSGGRLQPDDFTTGLRDMNGFTALAMSLNRAGSALTQQIDLFLKNAGRRKEQDSKKLIKRLEDLEKKIAAIGPKDVVYNMMIQTNEKGTAFGLVQAYTVEWYETSAKLRRSRSVALSGLYANLAAQKTDSSRANASREIQRIWKKYWKDLNAIGVYVDITKIFDDNGNYLVDYSAERTRLIDAMGSREQADKAIDEAQKLYHQYLENRDTYYNVTDQKFHEGIITAEQAAEEKNAFVSRHSPRKFFNDINQADPESTNEGDRYAVLRPLASQARFHDQKYDAIQDDSRMLEVYNEYLSIMQEYRRMLPAHVQKGLRDNFLPAVALSLVTEVSASQKYLDVLGRHVIDSLTGTKYEEERKNADSIPIRFLHKGKLKPEEVSHDLVRIAELFGIMALHYRHFSQVKDVVDMGEVILKETDRMRRSDQDNTQSLLTNTLGALKYAKEHMMYQNSRSLEVDTGLKVYSLNPFTQREMAKRAKDLLTQRYALEQQLMDPPEGKTIDDINKEIDELNNKLTQIEGQNIYLSKLGDRLIGINQLKALAFNPFSGFANLAFGIVSLATYSNGGKDFTMNEAFKAMGMMNSSTRKWLTFGAGNNPTAEKIMALMERTGMMGDIVDSQYGESNLAGRKNKFKKHIDPYSFLKSSDYYMKGSVMVATMLNTKVDVVENGETRQVSLWDAFDNEGNWKYENKEGWDNLDSSKQDKWESYRNRAIRVSQIVMGNMDKNSPKWMNKYILGRLIGQFRASWLPEGWAARFEDEKDDLQLGRKIKGRYRSYGDIGIEGSLVILGRQFLGMFSNQNYFDGITKKDGTPVASSEVDMENMKRNFTGMMWTLGLMGAVMAIKAAMPDDDDDDGFVKESFMIALNMVNRVNQDLQFYSSPDVANNLVRNAIPAFDVVNDYIKAVKATQKAIMSEDYDWDQAALRWTKATPFLNQINRIKFLTENDISEISR